jgi:hypothetical protein
MDVPASKRVKIKKFIKFISINIQTEVKRRVSGLKLLTPILQ